MKKFRKMLGQVYKSLESDQLLPEINADNSVDMGLNISECNWHVQIKIKEKYVLNLGV